MYKRSDEMQESKLVEGSTAAIFQNQNKLQISERERKRQKEKEREKEKMQDRYYISIRLNRGGIVSVLKRRFPRHLQEFIFSIWK